MLISDCSGFPCEETRRAIKPTADSKYPTEDALLRAMEAPEVRLHLQPLQGRQQKNEAEASRRSKSPGADSNEKRPMGSDSTSDYTKHSSPSRVTGLHRQVQDAMSEAICQ
jgi:hypothetical protein